MFKKLDLNSVLVFALIFSLALGQFTRLELTNQIVFYWHDILLAFLYLFNIRQLLENVKSSPLTRWLLLFASFSLISLLLSIPVYGFLNMGISSLYLWRFLFHLLSIFILPGLVKRLNIPFLLIGSGLLVAALGLLQYAFFPDQRALFLSGWDDHLNRLIMPYFDPSFTAVILGMTLLLSLQLFRYPFILILLPAFLLTYARSAFISLLFASFAISKRVAMVIALLVLLGVLLLPRRFGEGTNLLRLFSIEGRVERDYLSFERFKNKPVLGIGLNNLQWELSSDNDYPNRAKTANNSYIFLLSTTGIVGTVLILGFLYDLNRKSRYKSLWVFFLFASLFNNVLFYPFTLLWMLILESSDRS